MTVIAWDGVTLAADRRMTLGDMIGETCKLKRAKDGALLGMSGTLVTATRMIAWYEDQTQTFPDIPDGESADLLVVKPSGDVVGYFGDSIPIPVYSPFFALGSGAEAALAAMHCDATATEAVEIVSRVNASCGNGVDYLRLQ